MTEPVITFDDFKVGDSIEIGGTAWLDAGDWTITSWLNDAKGTKVAEFVVTLEALEEPTDDATHAVLFAIDAATVAGLKPGRYLSDGRVQEAGGYVEHSPTFEIQLQRAETGV